MGGGEDIKETEFEKEMAEIATEKWNLSKSTLQPLEDMMIADVSKGVTKQEREKVSGLAAAQHQSQFGKASEQAGKSLAASGVDPTSGKYQESLSDISRAGGASRAASEAEGEAGLQSNQLAEEMNLMRVGAGEATTAQAGMTDVAMRSSQKAKQEAQLAYQENQGLRELAGTIGGAASTYYGKKPSSQEFDARHADKFGVTG